MSSHSSASLDSIVTLSPDHPLTQTSPTPKPIRVSFHRMTAHTAVHTSLTLSSGMSARLAKATALGIEDEGPGSNDKGPGSEEGEAAPEGQQQAAPAEDTAVDEFLRLRYGALRRRKLELGEGSVPNTFEVRQSSRFVPEHEGAEKIYAFRQSTLVTWTPPSPEWSSGSLPVSTSSLAVPSPITSRVTTSAATISLDVDQLLEVKLMPREQLWHVIHDIQRKNHNLRRQIAKERHERLET
nr:hypothetical protein [Tanacetum cinerariifolium]